MKRTTLSAAASAIIAVVAILPSAAQAHGDRHGHGYGHDRRGYYEQSRYYEPSRHDGWQQVRYDNDRYNRGRSEHGRVYEVRREGRCRDNGTGGTVIGAIAGGLLGHEVAGRRGDKTMGTIIGAGVGAVAGRAIDRNC